MSRHWSQAFDQALGIRAEHVILGDLSPLFGLDPLGPQAALAPPLLEDRAQADHVQERALARDPPDSGAVVVIEVAVDCDASRLGKCDRLFDLAALEVALLQRTAVVHDLEAGTRASAQIAR